MEKQELFDQYRETDTHIYFWGSYLSNFFSTEFSHNNIKYKNSEQFFMAEKAKYFKDIDTLNKIIKEPNPLKCKKLGRTVKNFNQYSWDMVKEDKMFQACYLKFSQNDTIKNLLINTKNKILVEASPFDKIWGIGLKWDNDLVLNENDWKGLNLLGKTLMKVRLSLSQNNTEF